MWRTECYRLAKKRANEVVNPTWAGRMLDPWNSMEQLTPSMDPSGALAHPFNMTSQTACRYIFIDKPS